MSDEAVVVGQETADQPKRGRGRPKKVAAPFVTQTEPLEGKLAAVRAMRQAKVRHDADDSPIDGDYEPLKLANEDPDFHYQWFTEIDYQKRGYRGWEAEKWGPNCCRPAQAMLARQQAGANITHRELTLMKIPAARWAKIKEQDHAYKRHQVLLDAVLHPTTPGHTMKHHIETVQV